MTPSDVGIWETSHELKGVDGKWNWRKVGGRALHRHVQHLHCPQAPARAATVAARPQAVLPVPLPLPRVPQFFQAPPRSPTTGAPGAVSGSPTGPLAGTAASQAASGASSPGGSK